MITLKEQVRTHWKTFRPKLFRDLKKAKKLEAALDDAVERTLREMAELQAMGYMENEAWEIVRESYLFLPEEGKAPAQDSPLWRQIESTGASSFLGDSVTSKERTAEAEHHPICTVEQLKNALKDE